MTFVVKELSEEDQQLKEKLEMLVERLQVRKSPSLLDGSPLTNLV